MAHLIALCKYMYIYQAFFLVSYNQASSNE